jgi:hypothetical protein
MKKFLLGTLVMIAGLIAGVLALTAGARAETGGVMVHIHHDFIAGGNSFSAGTYKIYQGSQTGQWLILRSKETGASVFLLPNMHDGAFPGQFEAKLMQAGNLYYLSEVVTELGVYTLPAPRTQMQTTKKKKDHDKVAASGSTRAGSGAVTE